MPDFMFCGYGGKPPATPEEGEAMMARWKAWFAELGGSLVDPGSPFGARSALGDIAGGTPANGYMIIRAEDMDAAIALGKTCPAYEDGNGLEILELIRMGEHPDSD